MATRTSSRPKQKKTTPDAETLLIMELQQIHSAESQLARLLPKVDKAISSQSLRKCLDERSAEGERLLKGVEKALEECDSSPGRRRNAAAEGLLADVREHIQEVERGPALDAVLVAGLQKTEHYCIAAWGTAKALASATDQESAERAMSRALEEGKMFDQRLTELSEKELMPALLDSDDEGEEEPPRSGDGKQRPSREARA